MIRKINFKTRKISKIKLLYKFIDLLNLIDVPYAYEGSSDNEGLFEESLLFDVTIYNDKLKKFKKL